MISADKADKDFMKERTGLLFLNRKGNPSFFLSEWRRKEYGYKENNAEGKTAGTRNPGC